MSDLVEKALRLAFREGKENSFLKDPLSNPFTYYQLLLPMGINPYDLKLLGSMYVNLKARYKSQRSSLPEQYLNSSMGNLFTGFRTSNLPHQSYFVPNPKYFQIFKSNPLGYNPFDYLKHNFVPGSMTSQDFDAISKDYFTRRVSKIRSTQDYQDYLQVSHGKIKDRKKILEVFKNVYNNLYSISAYRGNSPDLFASKAKVLDSGPNQSSFKISCSRCNQPLKITVKQDASLYKTSTYPVNCPTCKMTFFINGKALQRGYQNIYNRNERKLKDVSGLSTEDLKHTNESSFKDLRNRESKQIRYNPDIEEELFPSSRNSSYIELPV